MTKQHPEHGAWKARPSSEDWQVPAQVRPVKAAPPAPATASAYLEHFDRTGKYSPGADEPRNASVRAAADAVLASRPRVYDAVEPESAPSRAKQVWTLILAAIGIFWIGAMVVGMILGGLNSTGGGAPPGDSGYSDCSHSMPQNC
ncbi:hypothetical protein ACQFYA_20785 [Promicromonospora sp. Marseille-Q5078]